MFRKWATPKQIPMYGSPSDTKPVYTIAPAWQYDAELHREVDTHKYFVWVTRGKENNLSEGDIVTLGDTQYEINEVMFLYGSQKGYITVH